MSENVRAIARGYRAASSAERAAFGMLTSFSSMLGIARAVNYAREQTRPTPRLRSLVRRIRTAPTDDGPRVHHFLPGIGVALAAGAAAIVSRNDRNELWFSVPFGSGAGLVLDEIALLVDVENPYWRSQTVALAQALLAAAAAAGLALRFRQLGAAPV